MIESQIDRRTESNLKTSHLLRTKSTIRIYEALANLNCLETNSTAFDELNIAALKKDLNKLFKFIEGRKNITFKDKIDYFAESLNYIKYRNETNKELRKMTLNIKQQIRIHSKFLKSTFRPSSTS